MMKFTIALVLLLTIALTQGKSLCVTKNVVPLLRYWNGREHFYTTNVHEIGTAKPGKTGKHGYKCEGNAGFVYKTKQRATAPLYRYWNGRDHFYTRNIHEIGTATPGKRGKHGYTSEGIAGYIYPRRSYPHLRPLYRYWNGRDHFYTTNIHEIGTARPGRRGRHGYTSEGITGYVEQSKRRCVPAHRARRCASWGDVHLQTPFGNYNDQFLGDLRLGASKHFIVDTRAKPWTKDRRGRSTTSVNTRVAVRINYRGKTNNVFWNQKSLVVNGVKCSVRNGVRSLRKNGVKAWGHKNRLVLRVGREAVTLTTHRIRGRAHRRRRKAKGLSNHHITVVINGQIGNAGLCVGKNQKATLFKGKRRPIFYLRHHSKRCTVASKKVAQRKCRRIKSLFSRMACVYDRCRGISAAQSVRDNIFVRRVNHILRIYRRARKAHKKHVARFSKLIAHRRRSVKHLRKRLRHHSKYSKHHSKYAKLHLHHLRKSNKSIRKLRKAIRKGVKKIRSYQKKIRGHRISIRNLSRKIRSVSHKIRRLRRYLGSAKRRSRHHSRWFRHHKYHGKRHRSVISSIKRTIKHHKRVIGHYHKKAKAHGKLAKIYSKIATRAKAALKKHHKSRRHVTVRKTTIHRR